MKTNGFVGKTTLVVMGLLWNTMLWAQSPGESADGRQADVLQTAESAVHQAPYDVNPYDDTGGGELGIVRIRDDSAVSADSDADADMIFSSGEDAGCVVDPDADSDDSGTFLGFGRPRTGRRGWFVGGSFLNLEADFDSNTAYFIEDQTGPVTTTTSRDFHFDSEASPRVWAGWQDDWGLGLRVTWFDFNDNERTSTTAPADFIFFNGLRTPTAAGRLLVGGTAGDFVVAKTSLEVYAIDAEITQELNFDNWQTSIGGGFRHGAISQKYRAVGTAGGVQAISNVGHRFDGQGPTIFGEVRIPVIGRGDRRQRGTVGFSLYGHVRGSILFGDAKLNATDINPSNPAADVAVAELKDTDNLTIGEVRVGGQLDMRSKGGSLLFLRGGWESQWLTGAGSLSDLNVDNDLVLSGWTFSAGADW